MSGSIIVFSELGAVTQMQGALDTLRLSTPVEVFLMLSLMSFIPILLMAVTTFARNIIVLSFLRQALGLQQTPPNMILMTLALFLTYFVMSPILTESYQKGVSPYLNKEIDAEQGLLRAWAPVKGFLLQQTREADLVLVYELSKKSIPKSTDEVDAGSLIPAFLLSELRTAFQIGFVIFLPFLIIDLVVASILMSLGMIMVPPITISLPLKIMLFVVVDGWTLITMTLVRSVAT